MNTEQWNFKKLPSRIHKAPKRFADEQADAGPAKKKKIIPKPRMTTTQKPTQPTQPSASKAALPVAPSHPSQPTPAPIDVDENPDDEHQSDTYDPTEISEHGSDDTPKKNQKNDDKSDANEDDAPEEEEAAEEEAAESAEIELSS